MRFQRRSLPWFAVATLFWAALYSPPAAAERPPQQRSQAAFVVKGVVTNVTTTKRGFDDYYRITIKVSEVEKGAIQKGGSLVVTAFQLVRKPPPGWVGASGHGAPPPVGATIMAYVTDRKEAGGYEGIYKNWFDLVPAGK